MLSNFWRLSALSSAIELRLCKHALQTANVAAISN